MKILFLQKRLLFPHNTGGKIRSLGVLRFLAKRHEVTYVCNLLPEERPFVDQMKSIGVKLKTVDWVEAPRRSLSFAWLATKNLFSTRPLNVDKDFDAGLRQVVEQEVAAGDYDLLICDFVQMTRNCLGIALPKLLFQHNVEAEIFERLSNRYRGVFSRYLKLQANRMKRFEKTAGKYFDNIVAVSHRDQKRFESEYDWQSVDVIDTAVDTDYFQLNGDSTERSGAVFVGSMDWSPNVDGIHHFVRNVWPRVIQFRKNTSFTIVGRNPPASIKKYDGKMGIKVTGTVPDIRPYLAAGAVGVVPLLSGGGTRLKIFEYMAMKLPVVSTSLGAEGLPVHDEEHLLIRDDDCEFADAIIEMTTNKARRNEISSVAYQLVHSQYSSECIGKQFERSCVKAVDNWKARANE